MDYTKEIIKALKKQGAKGDLNDKTKFTDLGIDSLDLMDMIIGLEETLGIEFPDDELASLNTIGDLTKLIKELTAKNA